MHGAFSETPSPAGSRSGGEVATGSVAASAGASSGTPAAGAAAGAGGTAEGGAEPPSNIQVGLRAGSVDDNARFADYLAYRQAFSNLGITVHDFDVTERHVFTVTTPDGQPVIGADVAITDPTGANIAELRTYADGRALWFPKAEGAGSATTFTATVTKGGASTQVSVDRATLEHHVTLDATPSAGPRPLDVEFLVDATGSMGDEIAQLKASLADIATRIEALPGKPDIRFALTIYRDRVDTFLTRTWNFTPDLSSFQAAIAGVSADGGGDYPEDMQQGLHDAIAKPSWRGPGTVKLVFLIGDAPPHLDYPNDPDYITEAQTAARLGIKIESLAASGLDDQGEYVWRQVAEITLGQFLFLTYGPNGGPGDTTTHHVNGYTPMNLDDLVVGLVAQELSPGGNGSQGGGGQQSTTGTGQSQQPSGSG